MYRIDSPDIAALKPAYNPAGTQGYFQDTTATPTAFTAQWCNHVQEELVTVIQGMGLALDGEDDTLLWTGLQPRVSGLLSGAADTGSVSTDHLHAVIACSSSQAGGIPAGHSVCIGGDGLTVTGDFAVALGGGNNEVSGASSVIVGGGYHVVSASRAGILGGLEGIVSGNMSTLLGSYRAELHDANVIAGGYGASGITPAGANQNLKFWLSAQTGTARFAGNVSIGCDADDGSGPKAFINGTSGLGTFDGGLEVLTNKFTVDTSGDTDIAGDLDVVGDVTCETVSVTHGRNKQADTTTVAVSGLAAGSFATSTISNSKVTSASIVLWEFTTGSSGLVKGRTIPASGSFQVEFYNGSGSTITAEISVSYFILNAAV